MRQAILRTIHSLRPTPKLTRRQADMALRHEPPEGGDFYNSKADIFACAVYRRRGADAGTMLMHLEAIRRVPGAA